MATYLERLSNKQTHLYKKNARSYNDPINYNFLVELRPLSFSAELSAQRQSGIISA